MTLAHGLRIAPAFLESRRRSQPGGGFAAKASATAFKLPKISTAYLQAC